MKSWLTTRNTYVDYGMRFVVISEKDEVLRISHAVTSELFDRRLALPQYARKRIRWCEVVVSLKEGRCRSALPSEVYPFRCARFSRFRSPIGRGKASDGR